MKKRHRVEGVRFEDDSLVLQVDGKTHRFRLTEISERLRCAGDAERNKFVISPSGYGIRWPILDEDLSIDGLFRAPTRLRKTKGRAASLKKSATRH